MHQHDDPVRRHWTRTAEGTAGPWEALTAEPAGVTHREVDAGGAPALWVEPAAAGGGPLMCYIHGGGFVSGSVWTHRKLVGHLATAIGARALLVSYPYAPGQVHPAQLDRVTRAYTWLIGEGADPGRLVLAGDSCGAWLALSLAVRARDRGLPLPAAMLLISPWVDLTQRGASYRTNAATDPFFHKETVDALAANFLGPAGADDPAVDLLQADLTGLPPMLIQVGGDEGLLDDGRALHAMAGAGAHLEVYPGQLHTFQMAAGTTDAADRAVGDFAGWLRTHATVSMS
ncbi:alpha/beta hydrolase [Dactylosporangium aurantiacum]|uniref:Alpha/beta hydrolase n=1 Tax=Dactylosporangium aurantiacum TaxID=35754 RepID=A0A9Q9IPS4_9ACTN|nr:alpha/beta hydrolase [Dactylosporangium aurantiacum]MDG6103285.1 alpha/beta hydrolase [Dactylosporangium aurantiacum]UWZ57785.1 alpha/beta hydrolase [Dactylosporangium aurantiacum]